MEGTRSPGRPTRVRSPREIVAAVQMLSKQVAEQATSPASALVAVLSVEALCSIAEALDSVADELRQMRKG